MTDQQTIDAYNRGASAYAEKFARIGVLKDDIARAFAFINKQNASILELGCADGRDAVEILKYTNAYIGIDISEEMIRLARERIPNRQFLVADMSTYEFPHGLDLIFAFASLLHLDREEIRIILQKAHEALHSNGIVYLCVKQGAYEKFVRDDAYGSRTFYFYEKKDFAELAGDQFEIVYDRSENLMAQCWLMLALRKKS